ncbi:MAG: prephenate dehydrogenase [Candidatus Latescibacterota bacterium]|nr:prephenate dehydrogenase [Candidatus Latescibacterota bacterium]
MEFFQHVVIIGVGLIGGSMGLALRRAGYSGRIVGVSREKTVATAVELGAIESGYTYEQIEEALPGADLVVMCTPIQHILDYLPRVLETVDPGTLVTDVGSTKRRIVETAADVGRDDAFFIGGHPMAGSEKSGVNAADPFLFQNAIHILVPDDKAPQEHHQALRELLRGIGARVMELSADEHDTVVAAISHLPQLMATSLVEMVGRMDEQAGDGHFLSLAAGGFRDLTRIASSSFPMWRDICATNSDRIEAMIAQFVATLRVVGGNVGSEVLEQDFDFANRVRDTIPRDAKGFIHKLSEILVVAEDRPGVIAEIAGALAALEVNINDIEVMKVREGEGGTLRLGFDHEEAAERALAILNDLGHRARRP